MHGDNPQESMGGCVVINWLCLWFASKGVQVMVGVNLAEVIGVGAYYGAGMEVTTGAGTYKTRQKTC